MKLSLAHLVDPRLSPLVDMSRAFYADRGPRGGPNGLGELTKARAAMPPPVPSEPPAQVVVAEAAGRRVPVRLHVPADRTASGVLLHIHGGGFYLGSAAADDVANLRLADALGVVVASVDYRLAPEHPWPAAPDDCETAALWLADQASGRFGTSAFAVTGFSAGATLAVTTLLRLRDHGVTNLVGAVLQFGTYDLSARTPAGRRIADEYFLQAYAGDVADRTHPDLSPVYADLSALPPVLMVVGGADVLLEDNLAMAARLSAAGVDVDLRVYPEAPHGFTGHATPMGRAALDDVEGWLTQRYSLDAGHVPGLRSRT